MTCEKWLEDYIKARQPVTSAEVYLAGKESGFSRKEIKTARRWHGVYIDTQINSDETLWRWNP